MAEVGTYYITIMPDMSKFTGGVTGALSSAGTEGGRKYSSSFSEVLRGSAIGTALGQLATRAGSAIVGGLQTGIDRADTLRNFPRVMEAMGFSANEAEAQIAKIMERLRGLPASTQDVVRLTQAISDSTGDLGLAADASLAFTDAMIAQGASAGEITQAQGVLNRVLGKGSATTAQWSSLVSVMTPQLNACAESLLGAGASAEDLHAALEDGTVSWDDFLRSMVDLDQNGLHVVGRDMASFEEQARANSDGIGTAIQNMQWRIGTGWASIINAIGVDKISGPINALADTVQKGMEKVAGAIQYVQDAVGKTNIAENLGKVAQVIGDTLASIWNNGGPEALRSFADAMVNLIDNALQWLADHGDLVAAAVGAMVGAISALVGLQLGTWLAGLPAAFTALWAALSANPIGIIVTGLGALAMGLYTFFTQTEEGKKVWDDFCKAMSDLWEGLKHDWGVLVDAVTQSLDGTKVQMEVFKQNVQNIVDNIKRFVTGTWTAIVDTVLKTVSNFVTNVVTKFIEVKTNVITTVNNIRQGVMERFEAIRTAISDKVQAAKDKVTEVFDAIKTAIKEKIDAAKEAVKNAIDKIKSLMNFKWSLPKLKLPHFHISGTFSLFPPSVPHISVSWYKNGGIFDGPAIIGIGEGGREAALPLNSTSYKEIARGISGEIGAQTGNGVDIHDCTFVVRRDSDIEEVAQRLNTLIMRERMAMA